MAADEESTSTPAQRSYGRGFVEGLKAAGVVNIGEAMNAARLKSIENGLNGMQRKVYDCIPLSGPPISFPQILGEMKDRHGTRPEGPVVKACLAYLLDKKIIRAIDDKYLRTPQKPVLVGTVGPEATVTELSEPQSKNPLERMAEIECKLKALANELVGLSRSVGDVAVDAEMFIEKIKNDNAKVAQLKELLKSL